MALKIAGIDYELRNILLRDKPAEMLQASAKGTVPVLVLPEGVIMDESLEIMLWALKQNDPLCLLDNLEQSLELIKENDTDFKQALDKYKYPNRYEEDEVDWQAQASKFVNKLEQLLTENDYLFGKNPNLADFAIFPFIRQFKMPDEKYFLNNFPKTANWLDIMIQTDIFKQVMPKTKVYNHLDLKA